MRFSNFFPLLIPLDRKRILQYPALVSCTSIDWFCDWPRDALLEVAERYLEGMELGSKEGVRRTGTHTHMHRSSLWLNCFLMELLSELLQGAEWWRNTKVQD